MPTKNYGVKITDGLSDSESKKKVETMPENCETITIDKNGDYWLHFVDYRECHEVATLMETLHSRGFYAMASNCDTWPKFKVTGRKLVKIVEL